MRRPAFSPPARVFGLTPVVAGTVCCAVAALAYTVASICMRVLSALHCDPMWAICNKELVTVAVVGPWLLWEAVRGRRVLPAPRMAAILVLMGLATQLGGNLGTQWAYGIVGLAITISVVVGATLSAGAALGRLLLGEGVSLRSAAAIALLLAALALLALGAGSAGARIAPSSDLWLIAAAVGAACGAGVIYALLSTTIRHAATHSTRLGFVVLAVTLMGVLSLGPLSLGRLGPDALLATPAEQLGWMLAAGTFNLVGFLAITKGLQLSTVVRANVLNASQVALAALAGVTLFDEPPNTPLLLGVGATIFGIVLIDRPADGEL